MSTPKCVGIGIVSIRNWNPFIAAICYAARNLALILIDDYPIRDFRWKRNPLFFSLLMFLGEVLVGVFELFSIEWIEKRARDSILVVTNKLSKSPFSLLKPPKESKTSLFLVIFGLSIIEAICFYGLNVLNCIYTSSNNLQIEIRGFKLIFDFILGYFFLNYRVFKHHYLSTAILIVGITVMTAQEIVQERFEIYLPFVFFGHSLLLSVRDCIEKAVMNNKFIGAIRILFFRGVFGFSLMTLITLIVQFISCPDNMKFLCEDILKAFTFIGKGLLPLYFTLYFFSGAFYNLFSTLTKQDFNPAYMSVADYFCAIIWMIISVFVLGFRTRVSLYLIIGSYVLITIGCFLYNELIIFYCCNLHWNTKKEITRRGDEDLQSIDEYYNVIPIIQH